MHTSLTWFELRRSGAMSCSVIRKLSCVYLYHLLVFGLAYIGFASCALWRFCCLRWITQGFSARPLVRTFSPELVHLDLFRRRFRASFFPPFFTLFWCRGALSLGVPGGGRRSVSLAQSLKKISYVTICMCVYAGVYILSAYAYV